MKFRLKLTSLWAILFFLLLFLEFNCQKLYVHNPSYLKEEFPNGIQIVISPLGFRPLSGQLDGVVALANPLSACSNIQNVQNDVQDVFVFANDIQCLQTIKAKNIAKGGGLVGIIKQNINNTLHDKQIGVVHIPIIELNPSIFDKIIQQINKNISSQISMSIDFMAPQLTHDINIELWMSPTQSSTYSFLMNIQDFLKSQSSQVSFQPKYVLHSQKDKKGYIGCLSSGMYCPVQIQYEGKMEGTNIVEQTLRQIIIRDMGFNVWWKYIKNYYVQCLHNSRQDIMMYSSLLYACSQNSMILAGIDPQKVRLEFNNSFVGNRKQVDDNIYLREERQQYIKEQVSSYPTILINKKQYNNFNQETIMSVVCKMENTKSQQCQSMNNSGMQNTDILIAFAVVIAILVGTMAVYKIIMNRRMKKQMKTEVQQTLDQYYRYMDALQGDNFTSQKIQRKYSQQKKVNKQSNQNDLQVQMSSNKKKGGHQNLVQEND